MKDGLEEGWIRERMDGSFIHLLMYLVKHERMDGNDSLLCLI